MIEGAQAERTYSFVDGSRDGLESGRAGVGKEKESYRGLDIFWSGRCRRWRRQIRWVDRDGGEGGGGGGEATESASEREGHTHTESDRERQRERGTGQLAKSGASAQSKWVWP